MTRQCTGDWRDYLHEQLYAVAVRVTGDQPQAHAIADAGLRAAEPVQHTADDRAEMLRELRKGVGSAVNGPKLSALMRRAADEIEQLLAHTALVRQMPADAVRAEGFDVLEFKRVTDVLVGGNHLANVLIGAIGSDFASRFPPDYDSHATIARLYGQQMHDVWLAWRAIMQMREGAPVIAEHRGGSDV